MTRVEAFCSKQYPILQMELFCIRGNIHTCIFMSVTPITVFCKSSALFKNMLNMLSSFENNSFLVSPLPPSFQEKPKPKRNELWLFPPPPPLFLEAIHLVFLLMRTSQWKNINSYWCLLPLPQIYTHLWNTWQASHFSLFLNSLWDTAYSAYCVCQSYWGKNHIIMKLPTWELSWIWLQWAPPSLGHNLAACVCVGSRVSTQLPLPAPPHCPVRPARCLALLSPASLISVSSKYVSWDSPASLISVCVCLCVASACTQVASVRSRGGSRLWGNVCSDWQLQLMMFEPREAMQVARLWTVHVIGPAPLFFLSSSTGHLRDSCIALRTCCWHCCCLGAW